MEQNKKDRWNIAYKNFVQISYFGGFFAFLLLVLYVVKFEWIKEFISIDILIVSLVTPFAWYYLAQLFKKRDKKAISLSYIFLAILFAWSFFYGINIVMILIFGYLLYIVYKANKSGVNSPSISENI